MTKIIIHNPNEYERITSWINDTNTKDTDDMKRLREKIAQVAEMMTEQARANRPSGRPPIGRHVDKEGGEWL